jgi:RHS repeat-associated protein
MTPFDQPAWTGTPPGLPQPGTSGGHGEQGSPGTGNPPPGPAGASAAAAPLALPAITLPKGGGAIRGIDEKLSVGLATGTASLSVPVPCSPGRQGFGPSLSLAYDSGAGNGPFGLGWRLTARSITRKTSKGLPRYQDADDSDVFVLSDAEDLVPLLLRKGDSWVPDVGPDPSGAYTIRRYRPRAEAGFARIERWQHNTSGDVHWRSISRQNVTSLFGQDARSRIADPADPSRVFAWLLDFSFDDRGNAMALEYKPEDGVNVPAAAHERGRAVGANRYLKRVLYGNTTPYVPTADQALLAAWFFELVVDYGEHDPAAPQPTESTTWPCRSDPFSSYRSCFEIRTYRLCRRLLMFHRFPGGVDTAATLVRSMDLTYSADAPGDPALPAYSLLTSLTQRGYLSDGSGSYQAKQLPPLTLGYSPLALHDTVAVADPDTLANLPTGVDGKGWRWCDLDGEGLQGVLAEDDSAWYYKRNISAYTPDGSTPAVRFQPLDVVAAKPAGTGSARSPQLADLHSDGHLCAVDYAPPMPGYFARDDHGGWLPFTPFPSTAALDWSSPNVRTVDLDGDGLADVLLTEDDAFTWYPWLAGDGFGPGQRVPAARDEDAGPALVLAEGDSSVYLADMSGDGLADLVRIRNGEVCYWPNLGYGRFGAKIIMDAAPWFDAPDAFDARRVKLADIDGSGTADLIYIGTRRVAVWFSQSGNSYTASTTLSSFPGADALSEVTPTDLLGTGTTCLTWSSPLPSDSGRQLRYVDLMGGVKPHLLTSVINNVGAETTLTYATSTRYYVEDLLAGQPWVTRLAFPVHVVAQKQVTDRISGTQLTSSYRYRHGYFDGVEREFRGFARVDQTDTDLLPAASGTGNFTQTPPVTGGEFSLPPVLTRTWIHTGAYIDGAEIAAALSAEYYQGDTAAVHLGGTVFAGDITPEEMREACRALRGRVLRTEMYALDGSASAANPYTVTEHRYQACLLQPPSAASYGSVYACDLESLSSHYERDPNDPRVRHNLTLEVDSYGTVTKSASAGYPRRVSAYPEQATALLAYVEHDVKNADDQPGWYRIGIPVETRSYQLTGLVPAAPAGLYDVATLLSQAPMIPEIPFEATATGATPQKRMTGRTRTIYRANDLSGPLPTGQIDSLALVDRTYQLTMTPGLISQVYSAKTTTVAAATAATSPTGGFVDLDTDGSWWGPSARVFYSPDPASPDPAFAAQHFYLPQGNVDPFGGIATVTWENDLIVIGTTDPVGNTTSATVNYRVLQPWLVTDTNANRTGARFDELGVVTATALMGKAETGGADEGDHLDLTTSETSAADDPTVEFDYNLDAYRTWASDPSHDPGHPTPIWVHTRTRVRHKDPSTPWLETYAYMDGLGRVALTKAQAEPGVAPVRGGDGNLVRDQNNNLEFATTQTRWVGTGRVIYDNKANPIKAYEPFFDSSAAYDDEADLVQWGVTAITRYDPLSRAIRVDKPDGTYTSVEFDPWRQCASDENDNVLPSAWCAARTNGQLGADQQDAAAKAAAQANTPLVSDLDTLGRVFHIVADGIGGQLQSRLLLDISGRVLETTDALNRVVLTTTYDVTGGSIHTASVDAGERWLLPDAEGGPLLAWDSRDFQAQHTYDAARRPVGIYVTAGSGPQRLAQEITYGESLADARACNLRGATYQQCDQAGVATTIRRDFKGNILANSRQLLQDYSSDVDWSQAPALEPETFTTATTYDALNRPVAITTPDASVTTPTHNERSLLAQMSISLRGATTATSFVTSVIYNAKGQRELITYGNGSVISYTYDPESFRLIRLETTRPSAGNPLQDLTYVYDPVGNVTHIADAAQQTIFFANQVVTASADYTYDTIYRLTCTTGREHIGQAGRPPTSWDDSVGVSVPLPTDGQAMRNYTETYSYDHVSNLTSVVHVAANGNWSRTYAYDQPASPPGSNRLTSTTVGSVISNYTYDSNGNMITMPQLPVMVWDWRNQLQATALQAANDGASQTTHYRYDSSGQRVRKVTASPEGTPVRERSYFGGYEVYREYSPSGAITLERQSLHVTDGAAPICLVETITADGNAGPGAVPVSLSRYQFGNLLGSAVLELDPAAAVISYEEYYPYGSTSLQTGRSAAEVSLKRYRYIGKERDEESGLYYHGIRYYAPWLGRWTSCDPAGISKSPNPYEYVSSRPLVLVDETGLEGSHWIDIPLLDELAKAIDRKLNSDAYAAARSRTDQKPPDPVNIPVLVAKEGIQAANDLRKNPVQGAIQAATAFPSDFVAAIVTPDKNQAVASGIKATADAMKFAYHTMRAVDMAKGDSPGAPPAPPQGMAAGPKTSPDTTAPTAPGPSQGTADPASPLQPAPPEPTGGASTPNLGNDPGSGPLDFTEKDVFHEEEPWADHQHHLFPQDPKLTPYWERAGVNQGRAVKLDADWHLRVVHGSKGIAGVGKGGIWNENWRQFFDKNPNASREQIEKHLDEMKKGFNLENLPEIEYQKRPVR